MTQQITIDGNNGVYFVFKQKGRWTLYEVVGQMKGAINESTTLLDLQVNNEVRLVGFAVEPNITNDPYIGGFENEAPKRDTKESLPVKEGFVLHTLPCIDDKSTVILHNRDLTRKRPNTVEFQLLLFSLTYVKGFADQNLLAKCDYDVIGADGITYVSVRQKQGAKSGDLGGVCGNNHPRFEDSVPGLGEFDCKVYLPKQDYRIPMKNTGLCPIKPWVHHPSTREGENRDIFVSRIEKGQSIEIFVSASEFNEDEARNAVKINGNCVYDM